MAEGTLQACRAVEQIVPRSVVAHQFGYELRRGGGVARVVLQIARQRDSGGQGPGEIVACAACGPVCGAVTTATRARGDHLQGAAGNLRVAVVRGRRG